MLFSMSGVVGIIVDIGIVVMILLILRILKIPIITSPFGERRVQLWNEQLRDNENNNIFRTFWRYIRPFKTGREWKKEMIDKEVKKGLQEIKMVAGEISGGTRETIIHSLRKGNKVLVVAGCNLKCPTKDLKEFIKNPNFKLRISEKRPEHHKTIIGQNILLEEFHPPGEPYKKALGIENASDKTLDPHIEEFDSLFQKAQEIKSAEDLDKKTTCVIELGTCITKPEK